MKALLTVAMSLLVAGVMTLPAAAQSNNSQSNSNAKKATQNSQTSTWNRKQGKSQLTAAERQFMIKAAEDGQAEVQLGQLAAQKATDKSVKQFAQKMVNDHQAANQKLEAIASKKDVKLPNKMDPKDQAFMNRLEKLNGKQFDDAYMNHMVRDHNKDVALFQRESSRVTDPDLKSFIDQTLPTLQSHDMMAKNTDQSIGGNAANESMDGYHHRRTTTGANTTGNNPSNAGSSMR